MGNRQADWLMTGLEQPPSSAPAPLRPFVKGLHHDLRAVVAALVLPWSNAPVEGHIDRMKLLKRQVYGRAGITLCRQRFLPMTR